MKMDQSIVAIVRCEKPFEFVRMAVDLFKGLDQLFAKVPQCHTFKGGGFVTVTVCPEEGETWFALVTQEWDYQGKRFASDLP